MSISIQRWLPGGEEKSGGPEMSEMKEWYRQKSPTNMQFKEIPRLILESKEVLISIYHQISSQSSNICNKEKLQQGTETKTFNKGFDNG